MSSRMRTGVILGLALTAAKSVTADEQPGLPVLPGTHAQCAYWYDHRGAMSCESIISLNFVTMDQFREYNPSIGAGCSGIQTGNSYCVEIDRSIPTGNPTKTTTSTSSTSTTSTKTTPTTLTTSTSKSSTTSTTTTSTPTKPTNGIETPTPIQEGMVSNCDAFHFVQKGESCQAVLDKNGITLAQLFQWNPSVGSTCSGLWAEVNVCVSIIGHTPTPTNKPTTTNPGNGIPTPTPLQREIVSNCDAFYMVLKNENCDTVAAKNGITVAQLRQWNPSVGATCTGLWADAYACVSIIGHTPSPTNPGNGIQTPTPIQDGMTKNCKSFHFVDGQTCQNILDRYRISLADFSRWNPAVGNGCNSMWAKTYVCVAVL